MTSDSQAVAFSPDGAFVAAAELGSGRVGVHDGAIRTWDVRRRAATSVRIGRIVAATLDYSPDGRLLAAPGIAKGVRVHDARSGRLVARLKTADEGRSATFSPDGSLLATGDSSGHAQLWSTETWRPVGRRMFSHTARIQSLDFTPDGRTLLTAAGDGTMQLWDVGTQREIGPAVPVEPGSYLSAVFTPDGSRALAVGEIARGVRLNVDVRAWKAHACTVAGRPMTRREWADAVPGGSSSRSAPTQPITDRGRAGL